MRSVIALLTIGLLLAGCAGRAQRGPLGVLGEMIPRAGRTHAVLINGGGRPDINYQSHLLHVRSLVQLLRTGGVRPEDMAVFSSDGADPTPDLATREPVTESERWLIPQATLRPPIVHIDSVVEGVTLHPARKEALRAWFEQDGRRLRRGDTLLLYVTDHGHRNAEDLANNTIALWGEELSVTELRELLALLDPRVRVVMLMSQCYSGSFAHAIFRDGSAALPEGNVCGYFASPADRRAYGCYPENRGKDGVGHSFHFLDGLERLGRFPEANRRVMVADQTPDAPLTSSDFFLDRLVREKATGAQEGSSQLADALLAEAWQEPQRWESEIRLLDRMGQAFGVSSPRSLVELEKRSAELSTLSTQVATYASQWRKAFEALKVENLRRFVEAHPEWREPLAAGAPSPPEVTAGSTAARLMAELEPFSMSDPARYARLLSLRQKAQDAAALSYRAEVRLGALLRMRAVLTNIAGQVDVRRRGLPAEQTALARLTACEDLALASKPQAASAGDLEAPDPFPPLAEDERLLPSITPAWMGISYKPLPEAEQRRLGTHTGAVTVVTVQPDSPASAAGLEVGDVLLGPVGAPFDEPNQVREWTMRSEIGKPQVLAILRDGRPHRATLRPGQHPLEVPQLPAPPKVGAAAPPLKVDLVNGRQQIPRGKPRLLFFWATWCQICKKALPEVLAFEEARGVEVLAITDESPEIVDAFRQNAAEPLPRLLATDRQRITFQGYGVSGVPTFVLVDPEGIVRYYKTGYRAQTGLGIEGWRWPAEEPSGSTSNGTSSAAESSRGTP